MIKSFQTALILLVFSPILGAQLIYAVFKWIVYKVSGRKNRTVSVKDAIVAVLQGNKSKTLLEILDGINSLYSPDLVTYNGEANFSNTYLLINKLERKGAIRSEMVRGEDGHRRKVYSLARQLF